MKGIRMGAPDRQIQKPCERIMNQVNVNMYGVQAESLHIEGGEFIHQTIRTEAKRERRLDTLSTILRKVMAFVRKIFAGG